MAPDQSYEHQIAEVPQAAGPQGLLGALNKASAEGWECFHVLPAMQNAPNGQKVPVFHLLCRKPRVRILLPGEASLN
jgi:hypothetical protein